MKAERSRQSLEEGYKRIRWAGNGLLNGSSFYEAQRSPTPDDSFAKTFSSVGIDIPRTRSHHV